ncbi:serine hydrolase domain-containing protein [Amorphus orientalis]|uniref:CubicO group peptidase (Beta-lactamase class C family) n=1 Tax=Amorphus orientalis TaxID=649198 RepID=A0AAE3VL30_9HYPH|nr:serine hydrolase [Amorphus orientalis]MDQ0313883.1 CubicO group peptidase (beta-lactamase class C family) [Amorphus orientalis]
MAKFRLRSYFRWLAIGFAVVIVSVIVAAAWTLPPMLAIGSAYVAKTVCSGMYVSNLNLDRIWDEDVLGRENPLLNLYRVTVDDPVKQISASPFGVGVFERTAVHRDGLGCALAIGVSPSDLADETLPPMTGARENGALWPEGTGIDGPPPQALDAALERAFAEPEGANAGKLRTRAVVVVQNGRLIAERYADGITAATPLIGWSMAKTVTGALAGVAMAESDLALDIDHLLPQWSNDANPKSRIPFSALLDMTDGLAYNESYGSVTDTTRMLYESGNAVDFLAAMEQESPPGETWDYSSGATMLAMGAIRAALPTDQWLTFPREALFEPIGMTSAVFETDPAGTFMGPSWLSATARDWARFGLLILEKGLWEGEQVLPVGWVDTMVEPVEQSGGRMGKGQIWLQSGLSGDTIPPDTLWMRGHDGQTVAIVPSQDLVVVRLGMTNPQGLYDRNALLADVIGALPTGAASSQ